MLAAQSCNHVCRIKGLVDLDGRLCIIMERYDGNLDGLVARDYHQGMPLARALQVLVQVAEALKGLHGNLHRPIFHHDLKPQNILISDANGEAALADFGLSVLANTKSYVSKGKGYTVPYAAPEQMNEKIGPLSGKADVWALGLVAVYVLTGQSIYPPVMTEIQIMFRVGAQETAPEASSCRSRGNASAHENGSMVTLLLQVPASIRSSSPDLAALLESMLSIDPAQRPTAEQVHQRLRQISEARRNQFAA